jgi:sugar/nucleoside kinase (ribokinase family)
MRTRPYDILIVGELNVDILVKGNVEPSFGQVEKLVGSLQVCGGGSAAIFAAAAARLGLRVLFASIVGDDIFGRLMLDVMSAAGVDVSQVAVDPALSTGATIHLLRDDGDRAMLTDLGSIAEITIDLVDPDWYAAARHLHVASPFLLQGLYPSMPGMMRRAKRAGMTVSLDTNWDPAERWQLKGFIEHLDILLPNENELAAIAGERELEAAARAMLRRVPILAVKRGAQGAFGAQGESRIDVPAFAIDVQDTTGAGDTFDAGFLAAWLAGGSLHQALLLGSACAALTTTQVGGFNGQPGWEQALALVESQAPAYAEGLRALRPAG